ncbi:hypothetical protein AB0I28_38820 [Phytomonospora sp. NPDC050363]|uniref:hypothetical protein n=1 Tax=Phytomonospora sp. NPDC050363 TaxID=3155642 RepID=UPI0033FFCBD0
MGASDATGIIDLDRYTDDDIDGRAATAHWIRRLRGPWPRPVLIAVTALVTIVATLVTVRATDADPVAEPTAIDRPENSPWAILYGSAMLKIRDAGPPVFDGINAVDSGYRLEAALAPGDYRLEIACASELGGVAVEVLLSDGTGDVANTHAECDLDRTDARFTIDEAATVSVWVGSYQEASTAYAFAVVAE